MQLEIQVTPIAHSCEVALRILQNALQLSSIMLAYVIFLLLLCTQISCH